METIVAAAQDPPAKKGGEFWTIWERASQSARVATNTRQRPSGERTGSISMSHCILASRFGRTMTWLSTCSDEAPVRPIAILAKFIVVIQPYNHHVAKKFSAAKSTEIEDKTQKKCDQQMAI
mmetsp:Transcript_26073/g.55474  ORF Transcript_26073/g.55474 Transcript_26073/m.55474 type:complete len:122 (+) Transcript_26073:214-579(+)